MSPQISDMGLADHSRSCLRSGRVTPSQSAYFGDKEEISSFINIFPSTGNRGHDVHSKVKVLGCRGNGMPELRGCGGVTRACCSRQLLEDARAVIVRRRAVPLIPLYLNPHDQAWIGTCKQLSSYQRNGLMVLELPH